MKDEHTGRGLFDRAIELQGEINALAGAYMAEMDRQEEQRARFRRMTDALLELQEANAALGRAGGLAPDLLTADAEDVARVLQRNGLLKTLGIPPGGRPGAN